MKLVLPTIPKLRVVYAYLLLKAIESKSAVVGWNEIREALSIAGLTPTTGNVKKYILAMKAHEPPLIEYHSINIYTPLYKLLVYVVRFENGRRELEGATLGEAAIFRRDLVFALCHEETDNTTTFTDLLRAEAEDEIERMAKREELKEKALEVLLKENENKV